MVEGQASWPATWVHVRYVVRHLWTAAQVAPGRSTVHATAASRPLGTGWVAFAGPSGVGKSRLMNRLLAGGALDECHEDDCPVVDVHGVARGLIPTPHEVRATLVGAVAGWVLLDAEQPPGAVVDADAATVGRLLAATRPVWPLSWLPGPEGGPIAARPRSAPASGAFGSAPALVVPARHDTDATVVDAVRSWIAALPEPARPGQPAA